MLVRRLRGLEGNLDVALRIPKKRVLIGTFVIVILIVLAFKAASISAPMNGSYGWETASPQSQGMDGERLTRLKNDLAQSDTDAFLVVRNDRIVYEWYPNRYKVALGRFTEDLKGGNILAAGKDIARAFDPRKAPERRRHNLGAIAKSLEMGIALMIAVDAGKIGLDDPAWMYIPAWKDDAVKSRITIRNLATQTSGIENVRFPFETEGWKGQFSRSTASRFSLANTMAQVQSEPGTEYVYSSTGFYSLAYAISASLQGSDDTDIRHILDENVMRPAGIPPEDWDISYSGATYDVDGMELYAPAGAYTARAIARVGQVLLHRGQWEGQQLLPAASSDAILTYGAGPDVVRPPETPGTTIGGWTNFDGLWPEIPRDAFVAVGANHKVLLIVPSLDLIVVRLGGSLTGEGLWTEQGAPYFEALEQYLLNPVVGAVDIGSAAAK